MPSVTKVARKESGTASPISTDPFTSTPLTSPSSFHDSVAEAGKASLCAVSIPAVSHLVFVWYDEGPPQKKMRACRSLTTMPTRASVPGKSPLKTRETGLASLSSPPLQANTVSARNIRAGSVRTLDGERFTRGVTSPYVALPW